MPSSAPPVAIAPPTKGVRVDLPPSKVPGEALVDALNWFWLQGDFRVRPGYATWGASLAQRPVGIAQYSHNDGSQRIVVGTVAGWWKYNDATDAWVNITDNTIPLTGSEISQVAFRTFSKAGATWLLGVNGKDAPKRWNGTTATYANIGGTPPIAKCLMVVFDRVILGNLLSGGTISPVAVDVSANQDFDSGWGTVLTAVLAETPGEIRAMQEMGLQQGAIYKEDAIYLAIAQDGTIPFRFEVKQTNVPGPVSARAIAPIADGLHVYLARDLSLQAFDGIGARSLGYHIQKLIIDGAAAGYLQRAWIDWDSENQLIWVVFPEALTASDPNRGLVVEWPSLAAYPIKWASLKPSVGAKVRVPTGLTIGELVGTIGDQARTIGEFDETTPRMVIGDSGGQFHQDTGLDDAGTAISAHCETGLHELGRRAGFATLNSMDHRFEKASASQKVKVRVGTSDYGETRTLEADPTGTENELDIGNDGPYRTGHRLMARRLALRIEVSATQKTVWDGSEAFVMPRGMR